jgi:hypothetical protein
MGSARGASGFSSECQQRGDTKCEGRNGVTQSSLTAQFDAGALVNAGAGTQLLSIEIDEGVFNDFVIHLLLFFSRPFLDLQLSCSAGSVVAGGLRMANVPGGVLTFSGSNTAALPKVPSGGGLSFSPMFAFDATGSAPHRGISFSYDSENVLLRSSQPCHAAVRYSSYRTIAMQLLYTPGFARAADGTALAQYGTIVAYAKPDAIVTYDVQPFSIDSGDSQFEIYRIVSEAVTTLEGKFEKPPGFPNDGTYPGKELSLDPATMLVTDRVHEIGHMDALGRAYTQSFYVENLPPYDIGAYTPVKALKVSKLVDSIFSKEVIERARNAVAFRGLGKL